MAKDSEVRESLFALGFDLDEVGRATSYCARSFVDVLRDLQARARDIVSRMVDEHMGRCMLARSVGLLH